MSTLEVAAKAGAETTPATARAIRDFFMFETPIKLEKPKNKLKNFLLCAVAGLAGWFT
jgi:hypothetical protein